MIYDIRLTISHSYAHPAGNGRHLVRVLPKRIPGRQWVAANLTDVLPEPDERQDRVDFFGNALTSILHTRPHDEMKIKLACRVDVSAPQDWLDLSPDLAGLHRQVAACRDLGPEAPVHFLGPSYRLSPDRDISDFAARVARPGDAVAATVIRIGAALHAEMTFDSSATTVDTDAGEAFAQKRGVCQDLSHIMILALQSLGIPAGYVSGYLRTLPPPGTARLEGVDAMHAWVQAWCGAEQGWIEYDPTNATLVGTNHIVVGYGRDYSDVSPVIGHLRASGDQINAQSVDVVCVD